MRAVLFLAFFLSVIASTDWYPCPLISPLPDGQEPSISAIYPNFESAPGLRAECRMLTVPHNYDHPQGPTIDIHFKRIFKNSPAGKDQFWMLAGGPGGSGAELDPTGVKILSDPEVYNQMTIYIPDHRGTGRSHYLGCPDVSKPMECKKYVDEKYGDFLHGFTTTFAARDLIRGIRMMRNGTERVWLYSISYGTYWAQRYLHLVETEGHTDQADAVVLDSTCAMDATHASLLDVNLNQAGLSLLQHCSQSADCAAHFARKDTLNALYTVWFQTQQGLGCPARLGLHTQELSMVLMGLLTDPIARPMVPALVHRLLRCSDEDLHTLRQLFGPGNAPMARLVQQAARDSWGAAGVLGDAGNGTLMSVYGSPILGWNILFSEMWTGNHAYSKTEYRPEGIAAWSEVSFFATQGPPRMAPLRATWNMYRPDGTWFKYPKTERPVLLLHGDLDQATPYAWAHHIASHYTGPTQHLVTVPLSPHCTLSRALMQGGGTTCGWEIIRSFLYESFRSPDTSCLHRLRPIDFAGAMRDTRELSLLLWGTPDIWGDA